MQHADAASRAASMQPSVAALRARLADVRPALLTAYALIVVVLVRL
jgi:hypothetical protein